MKVGRIVSSQNIMLPVDGDIVSTMLRFGDSIKNEIECCIPAQVEDYDRESHIATVRRLDSDVMANGEHTENVPMRVRVMRVQCGGFLIDAPIFPGDVGWIVASDKDTTLIRQQNDKIQQKGDMIVRGESVTYGKGNQGPQVVNTSLRHNFSYGFFVPDCWARIKIPKELNDSLIVQNADGKGDASGRIYITPEGEVGLESAKKGVKVKADVEATGDAKLDGTLTVTKDIVLGSKRISLSENDIAGKQEVKFRKVRFATGVRNGNLVYQTAYVLGTSAVDDGKMGLAAPNNNQLGGGGGADYRMESGDNSNVTFSVDGGDEQTYLDVNSSLTGKTVKMNVYYV